ncbi:alpha/beta hydrolase fold domain-containing protein [Streptomyces flaveolus]|uniref:Alpha/beta hydrolase fold domain-containing protein n=1 Tax=Streptomyces flaveolus TaxID=67297 RepID=A0ABV1VJC0_9ACTN
MALTLEVIMTNSKYPAPPFATELKPVLEAVLQAFNSSLHPEDIPALRSGSFTPGLEELVKGRPIEHFERTVPGPQGAPDILISVFRRTDHVTPGPAFFFTHVGGLVFGDRFVGVAPFVDYVEQLDAVVVTVEYRLAPENPAPAQVEDAYAALKWTAEHADELGFDPAKLIAAGMSAGGGLAAAVALKARDDSEGPALAGQLLIYPMLDDRNDTVSSHQIDGIGVWDRTSNFTGWNAALGERRGTDAVSIYESPGRATDLSNLPPAYIETGSADLVRDESVAYASNLWAAGGSADLHVWAGGFHLYTLVAADSVIGAASLDARLSWVRRTLEL